MRLVLISDTHCQLGKVVVPDGDVLVHAGDLTYRGELDMVARELSVLAALPHRTKVVISGNHDWLFQREPEIARNLCRERGITYLEDSACEVDGFKFWGTPWQPEFCNWAFNLSRDDGSLEEAWARIPDDTEVLVTHGPPRKVGDLTAGYDGDPREHVGCYDLRQRIGKLLNLKLHVFGHIHAGYGVYPPDPPDFVPSNNQPIRRNIAVNASICNEQYNPVNIPVVIDL